MKSYIGLYLFYRPLCSLFCVVTVDSSADDDLQPTNMDWEQLLAATFDPADAMFLGPDEMFSLNRNDVLYAQKYAAARTSSAAAQPVSGERGGIDDRELERCADDLDRFVNDLELACANIGQRGDGETEVRGELPISNAGGHDLDLNTDPNLGHVDNFDHCQRKSPPTDGQTDLISAHQGHTVNLDLGEGYGVEEQLLDNSADDIRGLELKSVEELSTKNRLQDSDNHLVERHDSEEQDDSQRRVLADLDPNDLDVTNGPDSIALCEMTDDHAAVHRRYPYDPDPEATVV